MRASYVFRNGRFVEKKTGAPMVTPDRVASPFVVSDVAYVSPLSRQPITSRSQRREEMKIHGVREVDPSEYKPVYRNKANAERMRGEHDPKAGQPDYGDAAPFKRLSKDELPERLRKTVEKPT